MIIDCDLFLSLVDRNTENIEPHMGKREASDLVLKIGISLLTSCTFGSQFDPERRSTVFRVECFLFFCNRADSVQHA